MLVMMRVAAGGLDERLGKIEECVVALEERRSWILALAKTNDAATQIGRLRLVLAFLGAAFLPLVLFAAVLATLSLDGAVSRNPYLKEMAERLGFWAVWLRQFQTIIALGLVFGGVIPALLAGFVAYMALRTRLQVTIENCMLIGGFLANTQWLLFALLMRNPFFPSRIMESGTGHTVLVQAGRRTLEGWISLGTFAAMMFALGALGGLVFWLTVRDRMPASRQSAA